MTLNDMKAKQEALVKEREKQLAKKEQSKELQLWVLPSRWSLCLGAGEAVPACGSREVGVPLIIRALLVNLNGPRAVGLWACAVWDLPCTEHTGGSGSENGPWGCGRAW